MLPRTLKRQREQYKNIFKEMLIFQGLRENRYPLMAAKQGPEAER
jgi:hypothetical protein